MAVQTLATPGGVDVPHVLEGFDPNGRFDPELAALVATQGAVEAGQDADLRLLAQEALELGGLRAISHLHVDVPDGALPPQADGCDVPDQPAALGDGGTHGGKLAGPVGLLDAIYEVDGHSRRP